MSMESTRGVDAVLGDKRILITGAASGMGREIAIEAARQGATQVGITDVNQAELRATADLVSAAGAKPVTVTADLRSSAEIKAAIDEFAGACGGLDTLVNNAGVLDSACADGDRFTVDTIDEAVWDAVMDINLKAAWLTTKYAAPYLRDSGRGPSVVNAASVSGMTGSAMVGYSVSKAALIQLTRVAAVNLAPKVRVNCYCPGSIKTPMSDFHLNSAEDRDARARSMFGTHLIPRRGYVNEVAQVACFLASDAASFVTGVCLPVDGGTMAWRGVDENVVAD